MDDPAALTYAGYLRLETLLGAQAPRTDEHDELLFIVIHQVYELWFAEILHELALLQRRLAAGDAAGSVRTARRIATILKTVVGQLDVLETMTPRQFAAFRPELGTSSGFQSAQFRLIEAVLGRRDFPDAPADPVLAAATTRPPVFASLLAYLAATDHPVPAAALAHDPAAPWQPDPAVQRLLAAVYGTDGGPHVEVCEALLDIDEGLQEWRYRHAKMVERIIGTRTGTGGSTGVEYLRKAASRAAFPDLWAVRSLS